MVWKENEFMWSQKKVDTKVFELKLRSDENISHVFKFKDLTYFHGATNICTFHSSYSI